VPPHDATAMSRTSKRNMARILAHPRHRCSPHRGMPSFSLIDMRGSPVAANSFAGMRGCEMSRKERNRRRRRPMERDEGRGTNMYQVDHHRRQRLAIHFSITADQTAVSAFRIEATLVLGAFFQRCRR
jgi:hypothetical protein